MQIIKCDFCGAEIEENVNLMWDKTFASPDRSGWGKLRTQDPEEVEKTYIRDICPNCIPRRDK